jgi:hypothetical protein
MRRLGAFVLIAALVACGGGGGASAPTTSNPNPPPTPTPAPTPTPNAFAQGCGNPLPAFSDAYGYGVKVQLEPTRNKKVLNASPLVRNNAYCQTAVGVNAVFCNTRREDSAEREACDHYMSGVSDTGRPGPNWFQDVNGRLLRCGGFGVPEEGPGCSLNATNQYLLDVFAGGTYVACSKATGSCGGCRLDDDDFGVIHNNPAGLCKQ